MYRRILPLLLLLLGACAHRPSAEEQAIADSMEADSDNIENVSDGPLIGGNIQFVDAGMPDPGERHAAPTIDYFPPSLAEPSIACPYVKHLEPVLSEFQNRWYSHHLAAAGEPSLFLESRNRTAGGRSLRFTWLPTFDHPVVVRVETDASSEARLVAVRLSGAGGYDPGTAQDRIERLLTPAETRNLEAVLARTNLFRLPSKSCDLGADGSEWIFEAADQGGYHYLNQWTPRKGPAREVGLFLLSLTGWRFENVY